MVDQNEEGRMGEETKRERGKGRKMRACPSARLQSKFAKGAHLFRLRAPHVALLWHAISNSSPSPFTTWYHVHMSAQDSLIPYDSGEW